MKAPIFCNCICRVSALFCVQQEVNIINRERTGKWSWKKRTGWRDIPIPYRCQDCPYPRVGFVCCDSKQDTCLRTDMEAIEARQFRSKINA